MAGVTTEWMSSPKLNTGSVEARVKRTPSWLFANPSLKSRWSDFSGCSGSLATPLYVPASTQRWEPE
jgi:hypothetical protein